MDQSLMFTSSSLLMGLLFAYSAAVQLNDPDRYFWLPLYSFAAAVTLLRAIFASQALRQVAILALSGGFFLHLKVVLEAFVNGLSGFWSLDMRERVVREKIGSGLVVASMLFHLKASRVARDPNKGNREDVTAFVVTGMAILVAVSYGLSFYYFSFVMGNAKFS